MGSCVCAGNEEEKLKDFFHNVIGIKSEAVLEVLAENSEICKLKAKTLLMKENGSFSKTI